ncbi:exonuclease domain-containing protein [Flavobacteriaceae bacterium 3-367]
MYSIVDIETTGNGILGNKITEIAIFKHDGHRVVDEFTSLVDPECEIPYFITGLTGIDNHLVRNAPKIHEIADRILELTQDTIFVAHSVNFDYKVIKNELKILGIDFTRKKLCTVRLSRRLFPGYRSYSLGKLCSALDIPLMDRHRARGDAHATVLLFQKLLLAQGADAIFKSFLNARSQEATLPPGLPKEVFTSLPMQPGIYYFKNDKGQIIYVGKAKNLKKRVLGHFYDKADKEVQMCRETSAIDFELSGSELVALLMESAAIKQHYPLYNRAQKKSTQQYAIFCYEDRNGILHLAYNRLKLVPRPLATFYNLADCRSYLQRICMSEELCPKYCHLQENVSSCSHYSITSCGGICTGKESIEAYNEKVRSAIAHMGRSGENLLIKERGRTLEEDAIVLIRENRYCGYGFIEKTMEIKTLEDIEAYILPQKDTVDAQRIVQSFIQRNPESILMFDTVHELPVSNER